jgi:hypothetical protein
MRAATAGGHAVSRKYKNAVRGSPKAGARETIQTNTVVGRLVDPSVLENSKSIEVK